MEEKYEVIYKFKDLKDNDHIYKVGDIYPREGLELSKKRIKELSTNKNQIGKILIKKIEEDIEKKEETAKEQTEEEVEDAEKMLKNRGVFNG